MIHQIAAVTFDWRCQVIDLDADRTLYDFVEDPPLAHELARQEQFKQYRGSGPFVPHDRPQYRMYQYNPYFLLQCLKGN